MVSNKRRIILVLISVSLGTVLAAMLYISRYGSIKPEYFSNMVMNFVFSFAMVLALGIYLSKRNKNKKS